MTLTQNQLGAPPPLAEGGLRVIALGGLGEIGRNMTVFEYGGRLLIVDCGVLFPEDHQPGVDLILPDFEYIRDRLDDIEAIVLTHGHEDHIGAVPYLLREKADIPLIGSRLTLAMVEAKLNEHRIKPYTLEVKEGQTEQVGPFDCEFVAVNHSIPDALAVAVRTAGRALVLHTGDFKMDQLPLDGRITDLRAFARLGEEGVDLFLADSTNAEVPGFIRTERDIAPVLDRVFARARRRIIVGLLRLARPPGAAGPRLPHKHGRKVAFVGRSMVRNMGVARDLGYLTIPSGLMVTVDELESLPGRQGRAGLHRLAGRADGGAVADGQPRPPDRDRRGRHRAARVLADPRQRERGLPRHQRALPAGRRRGPQGQRPGPRLRVTPAPASCSTATTSCGPRNVMPVHGEWRHLRANGDLAIRTGVPADRVIIADDGVVVDLVDGVAKIVGAVPCGYVYVDGSSVGDITESSLKDRRILGEEGFISVVVVVDSVTGKVVGGPEIHARGFAEDDTVFDSIRPKIAAALEDALREGTTDVYELQRVLRQAVGQVGERHPPAPPDDHPGGPRGLTRPGHPPGRRQDRGGKHGVGRVGCLRCVGSLRAWPAAPPPALLVRAHRRVRAGRRLPQGDRHGTEGRAAGAGHPRGRRATVPRRHAVVRPNAPGCSAEPAGGPAGCCLDCGSVSPTWSGAPAAASAREPGRARLSSTRRTAATASGCCSSAWACSSPPRPGGTWPARSGVQPEA